MTLQQLQYAVTVASAGTITEAAERLYITQPSLTTAIRELEKEMNLTIFIRSNRGVVVSKEGEVFLGYARQILEQTELLKEKYTNERQWGRNFCVSTQHLSLIHISEPTRHLRISYVCVSRRLKSYSSPAYF